MTIEDAETRGAQIIRDQGITLGHVETARTLARDGAHAEAAAFFIAAMSGVGGHGRRARLYDAAVSSVMRARADALAVAQLRRARIDDGEPVAAGGGLTIEDAETRGAGARLALLDRHAAHATPSVGLLPCQCSAHVEARRDVERETLAREAAELRERGRGSAGRALTIISQRDGSAVRIHGEHAPMRSVLSVHNGDGGASAVVGLSPDELIEIGVRLQAIGRRLRIDAGEPVNAGGGCGPQTRMPDEMREMNATLCERCQRDDPHNPGAGRACPGPAYIDGRDARDSCSCGCHDHDD